MTLSGKTPCSACLAVLLAATSLACSSDQKKTNDPAPEPAVRWIGRVDTRDPSAPKFSWSGSGFVARVSGPSIAVALTIERTSDTMFFQPVIDGTPGERFSVASGAQTVSLATGLSDGEHLVELYRENEGKFGDTVFGGFTEGALLPPPASPNRLIEIVGDSISAGYGNLGSEEHPNYGPDPDGGCRFTTETESAYMTYGAIAARELGADASIVALSGWGAYRDNGGSTRNVLSSVYENTLGTQPETPWSFEPKADVVVVNLGTNDFAQGDPGEVEFKGAVTSLVTTIRAKYPEAWIFLMIGPLLYDIGLTKGTAYLSAVVAEQNAAGDMRVKLANFGQQNSSLGTGCDYHPNVEVQRQMGQFIAAQVRTTELGW